MNFLTKIFGTKEENTKIFDTIVLCPHCFEPGLKFVPNFASGWLTRAKRYCPKCEYSGLLVLEIDKEEYYSIPANERARILKERFVEALEEEENEVDEEFF